MSNTSPVENLHYALGELAYAVARSGGQLKGLDRQKFHDCVAAEIGLGDSDFDLSEIIFQVLDKEGLETNIAYEWAMREMRLNSHYLSPALKKTFLSVMEKVAQTFHTVTEVGPNIVDRFRKDLKSIHGDPIYYTPVTRQHLPKQP